MQALSPEQQSDLFQTRTRNTNYTLNDDLNLNLLHH